MSRGIVTKPVPTLLEGGITCPVCGKPVSPSKTKPRATCSDNCKTILFRLKRRAGEPCTHSQHGTGTYRVSPGVANAALWFTSRAKGGPFLILGADLTFLKNRQPRDSRHKSKAFAADHRAAEAHDQSWPVQLYRNDDGRGSYKQRDKAANGGSEIANSNGDGGELVAAEERNLALGRMPGVENFIRRFGKRSKGGRHGIKKDWSQAIEVMIASEIFKAARTVKEKQK